MAFRIRSDLRTRARIRADQDAMTFPTDTQYNLILDECGRSVFADIVAAGYPIMETSTSINTNTGFNEIYPISTGTEIHKVTGVFGTIGGMAYELKRLQRDQEAAMQSITSNQCTHYLARVNPQTGDVGISFFPRPSGGSYIIQYILDWPGFTNDGSVWPYAARTDELIVLMAAAKGCRKEGEISDAEVLEHEYQSLWERVVQSIGSLDMRNGEVIRDVQGGSTATRGPFDYFADGLSDY